MTGKRGKSSLDQQANDSRADDDRRDALKKALQEKYEDIKNERVPDRLQRLIDALREAEHMSKTKGED